jgi:endonuclease-3
VGRISRRLGLTTHQDAEKVEADLMRVLPRAEWLDFTHRLIDHGRAVCAAPRPRCGACTLADLCPSVQSGDA